MQCIAFAAPVPGMELTEGFQPPELMLDYPRG